MADIVARWTDADLLAAWQVGYDYALAPYRIADLADDVRQTATAPPRLSYEERVAARIAEMEECARTVAAQIVLESAGAPRRPWGAAW